MINVSHFENKRLFCLGIYQAALMLWQHSIPMTLSQTEHMENSEITFCVCVCGESYLLVDHIQPC